MRNPFLRQQRTIKIDFKVSRCCEIIDLREVMKNAYF
jgi:hypothetical protein